MGAAAAGLAALPAAAEGAAAGGVTGVTGVVWARSALLMERSVRAAGEGEAGAAGVGDFSWAGRVAKLSSSGARARREWSMGKGVVVGAALD